MYVDSHAHLEGPKFDADRADVLARARAAGVNTILAIGSGTGPGTYDCALRIAEQHDWIFGTIGIHPHEAKLGGPADFNELQSLTKHPKLVAWGEIGLDYHYDHSPRDIQQHVFARQMELAAAAKLPIIVHCRPSNGSDNAWSDTFRLIRGHWSRHGLGGVFHCFTGDRRMMQQVLDLGFHISFSGVITFPKSEAIREAALHCPLDRMLIETDSPFLAPAPYRGKRNEPAFVVEVAKKLAELRGMYLGEIASATTSNFRRLFHM